MNIAFFSLPAFGHTNPTIPVVRQLVQRGHAVRYYSFAQFQEQIEQAGAAFVPCDRYLPPAPPNLDKKIGRDFSALVDMLVDTTLNLSTPITQDLSVWKPDCVVSDSLCFWGKAIAKKLNIPYVCSTTTFAFNAHTQKLMKPGFQEVFFMLKGMGKIQKKLKELAQHGYPATTVTDLIGNTNDTHTIVYTTREFQPMAGTFSDKFTFVGPSVLPPPPAERPPRPLIYISLGTVLNRNNKFYRHCFAALGGTPMDVVLSAGRETDIAALGPIPINFQVQPYVNQLEVLSRASLFLTHCGMNSVNESIYCGVPMLLFPQHSEESAVATRVAQLGMGVLLPKRLTPRAIQTAVTQVLGNPEYAKRTQTMSKSFRKAGGAAKAADAIEARCNQGKEPDVC